ncbi:hypothetical protein [Chryseobacterium sp. Mn2064]|uniref:hypothetical protein n=1 Tax=Chryseobacterium sp. Mn2064 TaxID=3395263 RepID=UPI003BD709E4
MEDFKHLKKEGNSYLVKQYMSLQHLIIAAWVCISVLILIYSSYQKTGVVLLIFFLLLAVVFLRPPKIYFDPVSKLLRVNNSGLNRKKLMYNLDDFEGFELQTFRIMGFIPIGCYLYANFKNVSKFKRPLVSQSFSKSTMQEVTNELEDLKI